MEGVLAAPSVYTQVTTGSPGNGAGTGGSSGGGVATGSPPTTVGGGSGGGGVAPPGGGGSGTSPYTLSLEMLLDLPILSQTDAPFGFYWVVCPANFHVVYDAAGNVLWPGATLYKSLDGGVTWGACASTRTKGTIGYSLSQAPYTGQLPDYVGSSTVTEEVSIVVATTFATDVLTSVTETALDNGANLCAIQRFATGLGATGFSQGATHKDEFEIVQFRDATRLFGNGWLLTGFRRGKYGTLSTGHSTNDIFVMLDHRVNVDAPESELNVELQYRIVTNGNAIVDPLGAGLNYFTNTGSSAGGSNSGGSGGTPPAGGGTTPGVGYFDNIAANFPFNVRVVTGTTTHFCRLTARR
jgi:hypothetical protein